MQNLRYVGNNLFVEKLSIKNILKKNKTPFYIYSESQIAFNFLKFANTFKKTEPLICFLISNTSGFANISPDFSPVSIRIRFTKIFLKFVYKVRDIIDFVNSQFWVYRK